MNDVKELSKIQQGYLRAIKQKHDLALNNELNAAVQDVLADLGVKLEGKDQVQLSGDYGKLIIVHPPQPPAAKPKPTPAIPKKSKK